MRFFRISVEKGGGFLSNASMAACIPSSCGMLVYKALTSIVQSIDVVGRL